MTKILAIIKLNEMILPILIEIDFDVDTYEDAYTKENKRLKKLIENKFPKADILWLGLLDSIRDYRIIEGLEEHV